MRLTDILGSLYSKLCNRKGLCFLYTRKEDEDFICSFGNPVDDFERSYYQYICQKRNDSDALKYIIANVISFTGMIFLRTKFVIKGKKIDKKQNYEAALTREFLKSMLPKEFDGKYIYQNFNEGSLSKDDLKYLSIMKKRYPYNFYFRFKCMCRLAAYSDIISRYNPKIIFCSAEYSFTSSVLTNYCERKKVEHINLMHGEKIFNIREAFCRFTKFYVWDEYYTNLFLSLRADNTKYIVEKMKMPNINVNNNKGKCTYYLQLQTKEQLYKIKEVLESSGLDYKLRPHPVYATNVIEEIFEKDRIENYKTVDIWESIGDAGLIISLDSTVLYQAYLQGATIVIDDVTNIALYNELSDRGYIMLNKPHMLLSEIQRM